MKKQYFEKEIKAFKEQLSFYDDEIKRYPDDNRLRENRAYYEGCFDMLVEFSKIFGEIKTKYEKENKDEHQQITRGKV